MLKIYLIITKGNLGGAQQYVGALADALHRSDDFSPEVIYGSGEGLSGILLESGVVSTQYPGLSNQSFFSDLRLALFLYRLYLRNRSAIFHFNSSKMLFAMYLLSMLVPSRNLLFTCHGFPWIQDVSGLKVGLKKFVFSYMIGSAAKVVCVSNFVKEELIRIGVSCDLHVIKNTLGRSRASKFILASNAVKDANEKRLGVVSFAELNANKGIKDFLLYLIGNAKNSLCDIYWDIYGEGSDYQDICRIIDSYQLSGSVRLLGSTSEPYSKIKKYDVLLAPSRNESFGMVVLEAAASGVYALVNRVGGLPEAVIPGMGRVCDGYEQMVDALRELSVHHSSFPNEHLTQSLEYWKVAEDVWACQHFDVYRK